MRYNTTGGSGNPLPKPEIEIIVKGETLTKPGLKVAFMTGDEAGGGYTENENRREEISSYVIGATICTCNMVGGFVCTCEAVITSRGSSTSSGSASSSSGSSSSQRRSSGGGTVCSCRPVH